MSEVEIVKEDRRKGPQHVEDRGLNNRFTIADIILGALLLVSMLSAFFLKDMHADFKRYITVTVQDNQRLTSHIEDLRAHTPVNKR